jgi:hypothetical protein
MQFGNLGKRKQELERKEKKRETLCAIVGIYHTRDLGIILEVRELFLVQRSYRGRTDSGFRKSSRKAGV